MGLLKKIAAERPPAEVRKALRAIGRVRPAPVKLPQGVKWGKR